MIGGGQGAFIGAVHRIAAALDNEAELVCGAFSSNAENSKMTGNQLYLDESRSYSTYHEMITTEAELPPDIKMDFVIIVTPNHLHFEPAKLALENGFHVMCDKPVTFDTNQAIALKSLIDETGLEFGLTHTYTGYPMIKQASDMVRSGIFGKVRKVVVEYPQGWLSTAVEQTDSKQAGWRTDPSKSGKAGSIGDIGTHAANLAETVVGDDIDELAADVSRYVEGRVLDDDANVLLRFKNGAKGVLHCSQISAGEENKINIRVWGEKGGIEWNQHDPNTMFVKWLEKPMEVYRTGNDYMNDRAKANTRTPFGHPEGYLEAFANLYSNFISTLRDRLEGNDPSTRDFPGIEDGIKGMKFIDAVIESGEKNASWIKVNS